MNIAVFHSPKARELVQVELSLELGSTVQAALRALPQEWPWVALMADFTAQDMSVSLWGRRVGLDEVLSTGDRLELCRPLIVDPMVARRERFKSQGSKSAGLFSKRRAGAKAGY